MSKVLEFAERLMRQPAAPYCEGGVAKEVKSICDEEGLEAERDAYGNWIVAINSHAKTRPLVLAAHMDHPGFRLKKTEGGWAGEFLGGVGDAYFKEGIRLVLMPGRKSGKLGPRIKDKTFEIEVGEDGEFQFAVWDLQDFSVKDGQIAGRACDDLIGVSAALAALVELKRGGGGERVMAAITRAEEVGFHGALALCASGKLPKDALVISIETSREIPPVRMGQGAIIRVGDRASVFDSRATRYLGEVAATLEPKGIQSQRALMSGGTCEGTAYQEEGYLTAAMCVALGNYHNCGAREEIAEEYVNAADVASLVAILAECGRRTNDYPALTGKLNERLGKLRAEALANLAGKGVTEA